MLVFVVPKVLLGSSLGFVRAHRCSSRPDQLEREHEEHESDDGPATHGGGFYGIGRSRRFCFALDPADHAHEHAMHSLATHGLTREAVSCLSIWLAWSSDAILKHQRGSASIAVTAVEKHERR